MKIATWNVNGIRARQAQVQDWIERERPDVVCLQEIKASADQLPVCALRDGRLLVLLARREGLLGRRPACEQGAVARAARLLAPAVRLREPDRARCGCRRSPWRRSTCRTAARTSPPRCASWRALEAFAAGARSERVAGRDLRRPQHRAHRHATCIRRSASRASIGQLPEERALLERIIGHGLVDVGRALDPDNDQMFTWWAPWRNMRQRNIGWRLDYVLASQAALRHACAAASCRRTSAPAITRRWWRNTGSERSDPKLQAPNPNHSQLPNPKGTPTFQIPMNFPLGFGSWAWLELGIWSLGFDTTLDKRITKY